MSRRKHVTAGLDGEAQAPKQGQFFVRALGSRGSNLVEVEFPDGRQTLVLLPAKFNKKLWVKRGGFLLIEESPSAEGDTKVTGAILSVLYEEQIKQIMKLPGVWPEEFKVKQDKASLEDMMPPSSSEDEAEAAEGGDGDKDGTMPPLQQNTNRKVVYHEVSDSDDD